MGEERPNLRWGVEQKLQFIEFRLFWEGHVNRSDLIEKFGVSPNQASGDLNRYLALAENNMIYDKSGKAYVRSSCFKPLFLKPDSTQYLAQIRSVAEGVVSPDDAWIGNLPVFDATPAPARGIDPIILRSIVIAIRRVFLLLDDKLTEIARTLGKVDDQGNVAEDLRAQILGQLSERLNYDRVYQEALSDPSLQRTTVELEAALSNAREAREVVFDLFQDLDGFSLDEYQPFSDVSTEMGRIVQFMSSSLPDRHQRLAKVDDQTYDLTVGDESRKVRFTLDRDVATSQEGIELLGLDHPLVQEELGRWRGLAPEQLGLSVSSDAISPTLLSFWIVESAVANGERRTTIQTIAVQPDGTRMPAIERQSAQYLNAPVAKPFLTAEERLELFRNVVEPTLQRELKHKGMATGDGSYSAELIGYVEISDR
jgi:hypothetical protein